MKALKSNSETQEMIKASLALYEFVIRFIVKNIMNLPLCMTAVPRPKKLPPWKKPSPKSIQRSFNRSTVL